MKKIAVGISIAVLAWLCLIAWMHDFVTLSGAKTVYTVECEGAWQGTTCGGPLVAADRYRFKILKARGEVLVWIADSTRPSAKLTRCNIQDAKDWSCPTFDNPQTIANAMVYGRPVAEPGKTRPFHSVPKWKWFLLDQGLRLFHSADT